MTGIAVDGLGGGSVVSLFAAKLLGAYIFSLTGLIWSADQVSKSTGPDYAAWGSLITAGTGGLLGILAWLDRRADRRERRREFDLQLQIDQLKKEGHGKVIVIEDGKIVSDSDADA